MLNTEDAHCVGCCWVVAGVAASSLVVLLPLSCGVCFVSNWGGKAPQDPYRVLVRRFDASVKHTAGAGKSFISGEQILSRFESFRDLPCPRWGGRHVESHHAVRRAGFGRDLSEHEYTEAFRFALP